MKALRATNNAVGDAETIWLRLRCAASRRRSEPNGFITAETPRSRRTRREPKAEVVYCLILVCALQSTEKSARSDRFTPFGNITSTDIHPRKTGIFTLPGALRVPLGLFAGASIKRRQITVFDSPRPAAGFSPQSVKESLRHHRSCVWYSPIAMQPCCLCGFTLTLISA
jgi:hypothetical protein